MQIRCATEDDELKWNDLVFKSNNSSYAQTWEWVKTIENGLNIKPVCLVAEVDSEIVGVFPAFIKQKIHYKKNTYIDGMLFSVFKTIWSPLDITWDIGGPCAITIKEQEIQQKLICSMEKYARRNLIFDITLSPFNDNLCDFLLLNKYRMKPRNTYIIDMDNKNEEELLKGIKKNARKCIRKAYESGVNIEEQTNDEGLNIFYACLKELNIKSMGNIEIPPYLFFEEMYNILKERNMIKIHIAYFNNTPIGGSLGIYYKDTVTFRYAKTLDKYRDIYPHYLLHWERIKEAKKLGYRFIDMGGIPVDSSNGIYTFKSKWGGVIINVDWYIKDILFPHTRNLIRKH
jgi:hypothetical protein